MMRRNPKPWFFLTPLFLFSLWLPAQTPLLDSLLLALKQHPQEDTTKANLLFHIADAYRRTDHNLALTYSDSLLPLAQKLKNEALLARAYILKGVALSLVQKPVESFELHLKALDLCAGKESYDWKKRQVQILINIAAAFWSNEAHRTALEYLTQAKTLVRELNEPAIESSIYWAMGLMYQSLEKQDSAILLFERAREDFLARQDSISAYILYDLLGVSHYDLADYTKARQYFSSALEFFTRKQIKSQQVNAAGGLGRTLYQMGEPLEAYRYLHQSLDLQRQTGAKGQLQNYQIMTQLFNEWNLPDSANYYLQKYIEEKEEEIAGQKGKLATQMELTYKLRQKETENQLLTQEKALADSRRQRYAITFLSLLLLFVLSAFFLYNFYQKNQKIQEQNERLSQLNQDIERRHQQLQRLASEKKHLVSLFTHDLRTPLMLIRLSLSKMMSGLPADSHNR